MIFTTDYKLAAGHNNAGGLIPITSITDGTNALVEPLVLPHYLRGVPRVRCDGRRSFAGQASTAFLFSMLTVPQWHYLRTTYEGLVTVRLTLNQGLTFANYNAVLQLPEINDLEYVINDSIAKPALSNVRVELLRLTAL
jgi:hypothetical protein